MTTGGVMACIRAPRSVRGSIDDIKADSTRNIVQIYTDWANYYLERGGCKRRVTDLQADLCDGVLLADLVEAVTNQKVIDINRKPKSAQQMVENVSLCVGALRALGADVGSVNPGELAAGSTLWPVLALLFALSRYKQRAKQLQDMPKLPSPYNKQSSGVGGVGGGSGGGTSIPLPATVAATRRCPPDKVRPAPAPTHQSQLVLSKLPGEGQNLYLLITYLHGWAPLMCAFTGGCSVLSLFLFLVTLATLYIYRDGIKTRMFICLDTDCVSPSFEIDFHVVHKLADQP